MKRVLVVLIVTLFASSAFADSCQKTLMPAFTAAQAKALCTKFGPYVAVSLVPQTDDTYSLGSSTLEWQNGYFDGTVRADAITADGDISFSASGNTIAIQEATAGAACSGTLTCDGASDVVTSTTCATTGSRIFLTRTSLDADTTGDFYVKSLSNGVSFTVACEASDTGTLNWLIVHESGAS